MNKNNVLNGVAVVVFIVLVLGLFWVLTKPATITTVNTTNVSTSTPAAGADASTILR